MPTKKPVLATHTKGKNETKFTKRKKPLTIRLNNNHAIMRLEKPAWKKA